MRPARLAAALLLVLAVAGCAVPNPYPATTAATPTTAVDAVASTRHLPTTIDIPRLGLHTTLVDTGLNPDKTLQVPPLDQPQQVAWYRGSSAPGDGNGIPAVVLAHVNAYGHPGAFAHLDQLVVGDLVTIGRDGAPPVTFRVRATELDPKTAFPTARVYGTTPDAQLRLITCGGVLNRAAHSYESNRVVYADLLA